MRRINALQTQPEFYNTLTTNCTTSIWTNNHVNPGRIPLSWKILASGYVPEYLYEQGRLQVTGLSFPELQERAHVSCPYFSNRIIANRLGPAQPRGIT